MRTIRAKRADLNPVIEPNKTKEPIDYRTATETVDYRTRSKKRNQANSLAKRYALGPANHPSQAELRITKTANRHSKKIGRGSRDRTEPSQVQPTRRETEDPPSTTVGSGLCHKVKPSKGHQKVIHIQQLHGHLKNLIPGRRNLPDNPSKTRIRQFAGRCAEGRRYTRGCRLSLFWQIQEPLHRTAHETEVSFRGHSSNHS